MNDMKVRDAKAEALESAGFYRRAAARWLAVMDKCPSEKEREWIAARRARCITQSRMPPVLLDNFGEVRKAADAAQRRMGIARTDGGAFRQYGEN